MRRFAKWNVLVLALAAGLFCAKGGYADTLSWTMSGTGVTGSGTMTATNEGGGEYLVTGMTGSLFINGTGGDITGFTSYMGTPGTYGVDPTGLYNYDDLIFPSATPQLDLWGLVFSVAGFTDPLNLCGGAGCSDGGLPYIQWNAGTAGPGNDLGYSSAYNEYPVTFSATLTPEPSAVALLLLGLAGLIFVVRRERLRAS